MESKAALQPHIYAGNLVICLTCLKPKDHANHYIGVQPKDNPFQNKEVIKDHSFVGTGQICGLCLRSSDTCIHVLQAQEPRILNSNGHKMQLCDGHSCPKCKKITTHDYKCGHSRDVLCSDCAQDSSQSINRKRDLENLLKESESPLTGQEWATIQVEHKDFVLHKLIRTKDGVLKPDWQEIVENHIRFLDKEQEVRKAQKQAAKLALKEVQFEEFTKLSPEEKAQYERDAKKLKKTDVEKLDKKTEKIASTKEKMIQLQAEAMILNNPKMTLEKAMDKARKLLSAEDQN
jgi:hypothetical protein